MEDNRIFIIQSTLFCRVVYLGRIVRSDYYFGKPGPDNTNDVVEAVSKRLGETGIKTVVAASDSGETALKLGKKIGGRAKLVVISMETVKKDVRAALEKMGAIIYENCIPAFRAKNLGCMKNTYYTLGQGFKVAVEVVVMAASKGAVKSGEDVIGVGGTGEGADTALIVKAAPPEDILGKDIGKRLEIREVIAMPHIKKWW